MPNHARELLVVAVPLVAALLGCGGGDGNAASGSGGHAGASSTGSSSGGGGQGGDVGVGGRGGAGGSGTNAGGSGGGASCIDPTVFASCLGGPPFTQETPGTTSVTQAPCNPANETVVTPATANLQTALNQGGAKICFSAGTYKVPNGGLNPPAGQTVRGEAGAVISGAVSISGFVATATAGVFVKHGVAFIVDPSPGGTFCETGNVCAYEEDVYADGNTLMKRVATLPALAPGQAQYYADTALGDLYVALAPGSHTFEIGSAKYAFQLQNDSVTIDGLRIEKFASPFNQGAVNLRGASGVVKNCDIRWNHAAGVTAYQAVGAVIRNNHLHENGQLGINMSTVDSSAKPSLVSHNEVDHNNADDFWRIDGASGGIKVYFVDGATVEYNDAHDNMATGIWVDGDGNQGMPSTHVDIVGNVARDNFARGIMFEVSDHGTIAYNDVHGNAVDPVATGHASCVALDPSHDGTAQLYCGGAIDVANGSALCIHDNRMAGNGNGVALIQDARPKQMSDVFVFSNAIDMSRGGHTGMAFTSGSNPNMPPFTGQNVRFDCNAYTLDGSSSTQFAAQAGAVDFTTWQAQPSSQDPSSTKSP